MVVDIRKELRRTNNVAPQRKPELNGIRSEEAVAENIAGPSAYYNRRGRARPVRVPCAVCTFVPKHMRGQDKLASYAAASTLQAEEEPEAEDIAGDPDVVLGLQTLQPIRVACTACTTNLRPSTARNLVKTTRRRKRGTTTRTDYPISKPGGAAISNCSAAQFRRSTTAGANTDHRIGRRDDVLAYDLPNTDSLDRNQQETVGSYTWFVRTEQISRPCSSVDVGTSLLDTPSRATVQVQDKEESIIIMASARSVCDDHHHAESKSVKVAEERGTVEISVPNDQEPNELVRGEKDYQHVVLREEQEQQQYRHDCFVKRVEKACARATGINIEAANIAQEGISTSSPNQLLQEGLGVASDREQYGVRRLSNMIISRGDDDDRNKVQVERIIQAPTTTTATTTISAPSAPTNVVSIRNKKDDESHSSLQVDRVIRSSRTSSSPAPSLPPDSSQYTAGTMASVNAAGGKKISTNGYKAELHPHQWMMESKESGAVPSEEESLLKNLRLSVEVFPTPSAKGFGLKIVQHLPKVVHVDYINGLNLSPRSFQTLSCDCCSSSPQ